MRIGIEASNMLAAHLTGIEYSLTEIVRQLARIDADHEYRLYFNFSRREYARRFEERVRPLLTDRVRASICRLPSFVVNEARTWLNWPIDSTLGRCDLVYYHAFDLRPQWFGHRVLTIHDLMPMTHGDLFPPIDVAYFSRHVPVMARRADALITVSQYTKDMVIERFGLPPETIHVVHPGVDRRFRPAPAAAVAELRGRLGLQRPYIAYVGTAEPRKNLPRLVRALARAHAAGERDLQLAIGGKSAWGSAALRACIADSGMDEHVKLLGYLDEPDVATFYSGAELAALPSIAEGFGSPLLEAMACGVPLLASNTTALPEVYGDAAIGVDPFDEDAMAAAIVRLRGDAALRADLVARGLRRAESFSWEATALKSLAVFEQAARPSARYAARNTAR